MAEGQSSTPTRGNPSPSDLIGTALVGAVGLAALVIGLGYGFLQESGEVGAGFVPVTTGGFIFLASLAEFVRMYFFAGPAKGGVMSVADSAESEAKAAMAGNKDEAEDLDTFGRSAWQRHLAIAKIFGLLLVTLLLIPVIGLLLSLTALVLVLLLWVERMPVIPAVLTTAAVLVGAYLIFIVFLGVPTPQGMLGFI